MMTGSSNGCCSVDRLGLATACSLDDPAVTARWVAAMTMAAAMDTMGRW